MKLHKCGVLVVGSGAAGLRAAIEAHDSGADVIVVGKCKKGDAHTVLATGGINAALATMDKQDNWVVHASDTLKEGGMLADYRNVETLCRNAPHAIEDLVKYGVKFARSSNGKLIQRFFGAHTYRRTCFVGDETGKAMEEALVREAKKRKFPFFENIYITTLATSEKRVNGAIGFDMLTGEYIVFESKCTVLATGGHSRLYRRSSSRIFENTGDGIALAYDVGAELQDMEMLQFHPTGMVFPKQAEGTLVTEAVRGEGGRLFNKKNERFMKRYIPDRMELGPRDQVARAIYSEIMAGRGTAHDGVWLDVTHLPKEYILSRLPKMYRQFHEYLGIDISRERMEVAPTAHYSMGGVKVNFANGFTGIPGLFAIGEVTGGLHGANRLGGNSLAETIVFGRITGSAAAAYAKKAKSVPVDYVTIKKAMVKVHDFLGKESLRSPNEIKKALQETMWENVGIVRNQKDMVHALREIHKLRKKMQYVLTGNKMAENESLVAALDVSGLLTAAEAVVKSAIMRKESRGAHFRKDYPSENKSWVVNIICKKSISGMHLYRAKVKPVKGAVARKLKSKKEIKYAFVE